MSESRQAYQVLILNTLAFTVCFSAWMMNGVLITYLVDHDVFLWSKAQMGWLIGIPVLTGSIFRLPVGVLTDKYGGRRVYAILMLLAAIPMYLMSHADSYYGFFLASLGFGLSGASFAVGIAYTSIWFSKQHQGTALGIFGVGNAGSALTTLGAPTVLMWLTDNHTHLDGWRNLPKMYAAALLLMAIIFYFATHEKRAEHTAGLSLRKRLEPLKFIRVWRFGLYYFLVFGAFVALAQWLVPYYVNVYSMSVTMAGLMASIFSLPSGLIRALGGYLSDKFGARRMMYWVLGSCAVGCALLCIPRMDIESPGQGIMAARSGVVTEATPLNVKVDERSYPLKQEPNGWRDRQEGNFLVMPIGEFWQVPVEHPGDKVIKKQLLARGVTHLFFQANVWIFTALVFAVGIMMGIGKAAVYRHIPDYYPDQVGVVGGIVGVIGGLGGFVCPIIFGYMLQGSGIWTTCWILLGAVAVISLVWMHLVIQKMMHKQVPDLMRQVDTTHESAVRT
ncbi:MAG: MFS transporter [bacterium]|nr:MFS transporter [bacterium]